MGFAMKAMSMDRKGFRLFRWLNDPFEIMKTLTTSDPAVLKIFNFLGKLHLMGFVVFDNMVWFANFKIIKFDMAWAKLWAPWCRFWAAVFQLIAAFLKMQKLMREAETSKEEKAVAASNK